MLICCEHTHTHKTITHHNMHTKAYSSGPCGSSTGLIWDLMCACAHTHTRHTHSLAHTHLHTHTHTVTCIYACTHIQPKTHKHMHTHTHTHTATTIQLHTINIPKKIKNKTLLTNPMIHLYCVKTPQKPRKVMAMMALPVTIIR